MPIPNTRRIETFDNSVLVESLEVHEDPPGTFTTTRRDGLGAIIETRSSNPEEVAGLVIKQDRGARLDAEQAVRDIDPATITNFAGARAAIEALQELMLLTSMTSDD